MRLNESTPTDGSSDRHPPVPPVPCYSDLSDRSRLCSTTQKVLLSIVDPWDVRVASVDPVGLAVRRGVSLSILSPTQDEAKASQEWPSLGGSIKIPSPWYKPGSGSTGHFSSAKFEEVTPIDTNFLHPWYTPRRYRRSLDLLVSLRSTWMKSARKPSRFIRVRSRSVKRNHEEIPFLRYNAQRDKTMYFTCMIPWIVNLFRIVIILGVVSWNSSHVKVEIYSRVNNYYLELGLEWDRFEFEIQ